MELDIERIKQETSAHLSRNRAILSALFFSGLLGFYIIYANAPPLTLHEQKILYRMPQSPEILQQMCHTIQKYSSKNSYYVIFSISYLYILLQSFSIPGPPLLNILLGALFGFIPSFALATLCSTLGSVLCYIIFETIGKGIAIRLFPTAIVSVHRKVYNNRHSMFFYLLSLRVTPFIPKWLAGISAPIIGVPLKTFAFSALLGLMPHHFIHVNTGVAISSMKDFGMTLENVLCLVGLGALSLLPTMFLKAKDKTN